MALTLEEQIRTMQRNTGTQRTATDAASDANEFIGGLRRTARSPATNPVDRVNRALEIYNTPVQTSRGDAEQTVNSTLADSVRRALLNQQRLAKNMAAPGSVDPVQFRAMLAEQRANQANVDQGLAALGNLRAAQVATRGQDIQSATTLAEREQVEAGAFDRAQLGLDEAEIAGQFGLAQEFTAGTLRNQGALAARTALNPLDAARLRIGAGIEQTVADLPAERQAPTLAALMDAYGGAALSPAFAAGTQEVQLADGSTISLSDDRALAVAAASDPRIRALLEQEGVVAAQEGALSRVVGGQQVNRGLPGLQTQTQASTEPTRTGPGLLGGTSVQQLLGREVDGRSTVAEIDQVIESGLSVDDEQYRPYLTRQWLGQNREFIGALPAARQRALYRRLGDVARPYLTIDIEE